MSDLVIGRMIPHAPGDIGPDRPRDLVLAHLEHITAAVHEDGLLDLIERLTAIMEKRNWPWLELNARNRDICFYRKREEGDLPTPPAA